MSAEIVLYSPAFEEALAGAKAFAGASKADRTIQVYRGAFDAFRAWCGTAGIAKPLPATAEATAAYLSHLAASGRKASTIDLHVAAIACAHRAAGYETPTSCEIVRTTVKGIRRRLGTKATRKAPATADALKRMLRKIPDTLVGKRDRALLLIGFAAALRRSELVALHVEDLERTDEGVLVHITRSKTDQEGAGHVVAVPAGSRLRPVQALDAWLDAAAITEGPVFRPLGKGGRVIAAALATGSVAQIVKDRAAAAGLDPKLFSGHSLRAGFVTSALEAGADLLKVMDVTRHREVGTLKVYDRRAQAFRNHAGKGFL
ncbi:site-specific integrase [Methylobacterium sp. J-070]|uniref:site-specific integrase n=1 Tax=Methylobacterium sp. J-070 TaxID=2836650 RepID=UPI001FB932F3|nr:site-specific integrase [Methylobacterium sp. J-070]MCJ2051211.1 site-specific integrase [Methylobacterium sp. J-070]